MEKKKSKHKDSTKMDSLFSLTQRTARAMPAVPDKKKDKKWSLGSLLKKISSIRDYESSSNEDDIVFCKRQPKNRASLDRTDGVVLRPVQRNSQKKQHLSSSLERNVGNALNPLVGRRDCRCSDGSLDGSGRKLRMNKVKARVEAKRDQLCAESSSDDDSRKSSSSLNRIQAEECTPNEQKLIPCHRKTRTARTERYLKRFSKDDPTSVDQTISPEVPLGRSGRTIPHLSNRFLPNHQLPVKAVHDTGATCESRCCSKYVDFNKNDTFGEHFCVGEDNHYGKIRRNDSHNNPIKLKPNFLETSFDGSTEHKIYTKSVEPPAPPPRDPRCRVFTYGCHSFPTDNKHRYDSRFYDRKNNLHAGKGEAVSVSRSSLSHDLDNEITRNDRTNWTQSRPVSLNSGLSTYNGFREMASDKYNSLPRGVPRSVNFKRESEAEEKYLPVNRRASFSNAFNNKYRTAVEDYWETVKRRNAANNDITEMSRCQRRNDRNDRLNVTNSSINDTADYRIISNAQSKLAPYAESCPIDKFRTSSPFEKYTRGAPLASDSVNNSAPAAVASENTKRMKPARNEEEKSVRRNGHTQRSADRSETIVDGRTEKDEDKNVKESMERRRSSKNLEEALSELEAIYNSLRLGDEDLLDRAERRSMHEYSLKQGVIAEDAAEITKRSDSPDRTKDDMAYRRMNPREKPSTDCITPLSNISYLITSPVLSRKDDLSEHLRSPSLHRHEPDVMLDDVVFRSINHANNTLRIVEPQPLFGIPLGPVTAAAESDYLHSTPKFDQPRSPFAPTNEPDVVTDDLAFRALRKDVGAVKGSAKYQQDLSRSPVPSSRCSSALDMVDQQPPFGIPIGPVVAASETDYLHAMPSKPETPRSPYLPQSQPDLVTDDLAYRSLRKDDKCQSINPGKDATVRIRSPINTFATKKKRAVRSLSANLYGLINQNRIHLHRQPSLSDIEDQFKDSLVNCVPGADYPEYLRRVVSDGEISDQDCRWRAKRKIQKTTKENKRDFAIGDIQSAYVCQKKLQVFISPTDTQEAGKDRESDSGAPASSLSGNSLTAKVFGDESLHDRQGSKSNISLSSRNSDRSVDSDLATYSRLCQDLADLIKSPDDDTAATVKVEPMIFEQAEIKHDSPEVSNPDDMGDTMRNDDLESTALHIDSLGSHYTKLDDDENEFPIIEEEPSAKSRSEEDSLDYYLRLADENVKLIAEAFSDVVDCLSDKGFGQSDTLHTNSEFQQDRELEENSEIHVTDDSEKSPIPQDDNPTEDKSNCSNDLELAATTLHSDNRTTEEEETDNPEELSNCEETLVSDIVSAEVDSTTNVLESECNDEDIGKIVEGSTDDREFSACHTASEDVSCDEEEIIVSSNVEEQKIVVKDESKVSGEGETTECEFHAKIKAFDGADPMEMCVSCVTNPSATAYTVILFACLVALLLANLFAS